MSPARAFGSVRRGSLFKGNSYAPSHQWPRDVHRNRPRAMALRELTWPSTVTSAPSSQTSSIVTRRPTIAAARCSLGSSA